MNSASYLSRAARIFADRPAVHDGTRSITYRVLEQRANRLANGLIGLGVSPGDRVALVLPNGIEWVESDYAIAKAAAITVPINPMVHEREIADYVGRSEPRVVITNATILARLPQDLSQRGIKTIVLGRERLTADWTYEGLIEKAASHAVCRDVEPDSGRVMRFTSGTTGNPKGVLLTHANWLAVAYSMLLDRVDLRRNDVYLASSPFAHAGGLALLPVAMRGAALRVVGKFDAEEVVRLIEAGQTSVVQLVPTALRRLLDVPKLTARNLSALRSVQYGGAPIEASTLTEALDVLGRILVQGYGLNEACMVTALAAEDHSKVLEYSGWQQPMGRETTLVDVRIVDQDGQEVPQGVAGELTVRGPVVFREYWRDPEATAAAKRDGWFYTGDLALRGADGDLYLAGRSKDIIITGGYNVSPEEVEAVLDQHPAVRQCAVVGLPHREWGEQIVAFVVRHKEKSVTEQELAELCQARLTRYKKPKAFRFVEELPVNSNGKIMRRGLRELYG